MAIFRGLNTSLYLGDVDNLNTALNNLGLNINDLNRIRGLADDITTAELHLLSGLESDQEKETYSAYRSSFTINSDMATLVDIYSNLSYPGTVHVNNQVRASALKYNFLQYPEAAPYYEVKSADISTSRVSSWSNIANTIFYGSELELNPDLGGGSFADNTESVVRADRILFKGNITEKRFDAEEPTDKVVINVNGQDYEFFAMRNIPVSFEGFFRDVTITSVTDEVSSSPTIVIVDFTTDPASEYEFPIGHFESREYRTFRSGRKRIDFYYRPDGILQLDIPKANISEWPTTLANLEYTDFTQNAFAVLPDFSTFAPNLITLVFSGNPLSTGGFSAGNQVLNLLPTSLNHLYISGTFTDASTINLTHLTNLRTLEFNSYWEGNNIRRSQDTGVAPIVNDNINTYNVIDQSFRYLPYQLSLASSQIQTINVFNNNILGMRNSGNTGTQTIYLNDAQNLQYLDLGKNSCEPVIVRNTLIEVYNHNDNFSFASADITEHFSNYDSLAPADVTSDQANLELLEASNNLQYLDFSNSFVRGNIDRMFVGLSSLVSADFTNTRLSGNFKEAAFAGSQIGEFTQFGGLGGSENYFDQFKITTLAQLTITKGLFNTTVDTDTNFWGNDLEPVQVAAGNNLYNIFMARAYENSDGDNSTNTTTLHAYKNGEGFNMTSNEGQSQTNIFENTFAGYFTGMNQSDVIGPMEFTSIVLGDISENSFNNNNGRVLLSDPNNTYAVNGNTSDFYGAVAVLRPDGSLQDTLTPNNVQYSYSGNDGRNRNFGFGEYLAINSQRMYVAFTGRKYTWSGRRNGSVEIYNWNGSLRTRIDGIRRNKQFGQLLTASEDYIWCCDKDRDVMWRFDINGGNRSEVINQNNIGDRQITSIKYYNDFLYVGAIGNDENTNGVIWKINPSTNAIVYTYEPQPDANTFNDIVTSPGIAYATYAFDEVEFSKYRQNFGFTFDVTEYTAANAEVIAISSYTDEVIRSANSVTYEASDIVISSMELVNGDQIRVNFDNLYRTQAYKIYKEISEADDNATIVVNYIDDNGDPQTITTDLDKNLSDFSNPSSIEIDTATSWPNDANTLVSFTMDVDRIDNVSPGAAIEIRNADDRQIANNTSISVLSRANRNYWSAHFPRAQHLYLAPRIANSATKEIELVIASSYDAKTDLTNTEPDGTKKTIVQFDSDLPYIDLGTGSTSNSYEGKNTESYLFNSFAIFEDKETANSSQIFRLFPALDKLKIGDNDGIAGKLPNLSYLVACTSLEIFKTSLEGPININGLNTLIDVKVNDNNLDGTFPETTLPNLKLLYINGNRFTELGKLITPKLEYFDCSINQISGTLPKFDEALAIKDINISSNQFDAYQSQSLSDNINLRKFDASNNLFTLNDAFRILDDMEDNYNLNNRAGVTVNLLGNAAISESLILQNSTYGAKLAFLKNVAGWTILVN